MSVLRLSDIDPELALDFDLNSPQPDLDGLDDEQIARRVRALRFKRHEAAQTATVFDRETVRISDAKERALAPLLADIESLESLLSAWFDRKRHAQLEAGTDPKKVKKSRVFPDGTIRSRTTTSVDDAPDLTAVPREFTSITTTITLAKATVKKAIRDAHLIVDDHGRCVTEHGEVLPLTVTETTKLSVDTEPVE